MWSRNDQPPKYFVEDDDDAERYPFFPIDTGHPVAALMALVCAVGVIFVLALVRP